MARVIVWNPTPTDSDDHDEAAGEHPDPGQPCRGCRGRGDEDCLTCGGEGYV